jgi:hypothetical protein
MHWLHESFEEDDGLVEDWHDGPLGPLLSLLPPQAAAIIRATVASRITKIFMESSVRRAGGGCAFASRFRKSTACAGPQGPPVRGVSRGSTLIPHGRHVRQHVRARALGAPRLAAPEAMPRGITLGGGPDGLSAASLPSGFLRRIERERARRGTRRR